MIILDRSGSMSAIRQAAIDGFNETLAGIRKAQEKFAKTQEHYVSLVAFCNCKTDAIFDKVPVGSARPITEADYEPCCGTPLYDAMGFTLAAMRKHVSGMADAVVVVTIITDGMENASREYSRAAIQRIKHIVCLIDPFHYRIPGCSLFLHACRCRFAFRKSESRIILNIDKTVELPYRTAHPL